MNISLPHNPLYRGLAYIFIGTLLLFYMFGFLYTIMNFVFAIIAVGLIAKGFMIAGFDKPAVALYNKAMKKK
jgi:hypothetical protein